MLRLKNSVLHGDVLKGATLQAHSALNDLMVFGYDKESVPV